MSTYRTEQQLQMDLPRVVVNLLEMLLKPNRQDRNLNNCTKCGEFHSYFEICKAKNRKCYNCRKYGHYSKLCRTKMATAPVNKPDVICSKIEHKKIEQSSKVIKEEVYPKVQESKIEICEAEDSEIENLYVCGIMPYFEIENDVLIRKYNFNSSVQMKYNKMKCQINQMSEKITNLENKCNTVKSTTQEKKTTSTNLDTVKILVKEIADLSSFLCTMFLMFNDWGDAEGWYDYDLKRENFYCGKCGSKEFHAEDWCPKSRIKAPCQLCQSPEHFSAFCSNLVK